MNFYIIAWALISALAISGIYLIFYYGTHQSKRGDMNLNEAYGFLIGILLLFLSFTFGGALWYRH